VQQRIADLEEQAALEAAWLQSESYIQAGDWLGAIGTLTQIRGQNPSFRRAQVEEQLYQVYAQIARELIAQANGSVDTLRQAVGYLDSALALRPTQKDLLEERRLAYEFVAGEDAWAKQDWASAAAHWETVYATRPDYQGGVLRDKLRQAYPLAARQLIAEAQGRVSLLNQAVAYLDQALLAQPDNQELVEERQLLLEFIAGAQAFEQRAWDIAISHWGAIYLVRPAYQDGALEEQLRLACQRSSEPDESLCPP
jgi:tetratricopeptide (TPR) repeat protein